MNRIFSIGDVVMKDRNDSCFGWAQSCSYAFGVDCMLHLMAYTDTSHCITVVCQVCLGLSCWSCCVSSCFLTVGDITYLPSSCTSHSIYWWMHLCVRCSVFVSWCVWPVCDVLTACSSCLQFKQVLERWKQQ